MGTAEKWRLFIGTQVPPSTADLITEAMGRELSRPHWRVAPPAQWHVTSLFIGARPLDQLEIIKEKVRTIAARTTPFILTEGRPVLMPKEVPEMVWVKFQASPELTRLHHTLAAAMAMPPSSYVPYWPHITLARCKGVAPSLSEVQLHLSDFEVNALTLFRSESGPAGTIHRPIAEWPLSGTGPTGHSVGS